MYQKIILRFILFFFLAVVLSPALASSQSLPTPDTSKALRSNPKRLLQVQGLFDALAAKGENLPVIVELNTSFLPEGKLSGVQAVTDQRSRIAGVQGQVINALQGLAVENIKKFGTIPFMGMKVDQNALNGLVNNPWIKNIGEDQLERPSLDLSVPRIGGDQAWAAGFTGIGWAVAVLDSGVDKIHPFLTGKVVSEACYSTTDPNYNATSVCPEGNDSSTVAGSGENCTVAGCGHGTHVAGIVAGTGAFDDATGTSFSGVAKGANVIAVQIFSRIDDTNWCGGEPTCIGSFESDQISGLERIYALRNTYNIASVNMSLGGGQYYSNCDAAQSSRKAIIDNLRGAGIATVIASGNEYFTDSMNAPGCISTAVSVGATDGSDVVASYSNSALFLNLLAPGSAINSSVPGGTYESWSGTSMATPNVAGCWALIKQAAPSASVDQVLAALKSTGTLIMDAKNSITKPRINCYAALQQLAPGADFSWPMFLPAITRKHPETYWGASSAVYCTSSAATFSLTSSGVTKNSACDAGGCAGGSGTFEGWVTTDPG